jgi:hyperosmotically inducible protein
MRRRVEEPSNLPAKIDSKENRTMRTIRSSYRAVILAIAMAALAAAPAVFAADQQDLAAAVRSKLSGSQFRNVRVTADANGDVTLSGTVDLYEYKADADKKTHKVKGVTAVRNDIQVGGPSLTDEQIEKKLGPALAYSRMGYGNVFDAILLHVQNGVVTLSGHVHNYPNRDAAVAEAATTPGVKEVIDDIEVDPVSQMDDQIRIAVARAIYGFPALQRYAIDPVRPIRISVQNGNVALYGTVDSQQDKQMAFMRASAVPGVFSVKNYLTVEGQPTEKQQEQIPQE